ncbi:MAG: DUF169 domain-containing protein [Candidatus Omnitrophica bacterium]|nr:DUF169 domain-containing protein [Candidatus Omnitrophota bacterium]
MAEEHICAQEKQWQKDALALKEVLKLEMLPVGISIIQSQPVDNQDKIRICKAFLEAAKGKTIKINKDNNACFGAAWHLGFHKLQEGSKIMQMVRKFVVEGEKLFSSYEALDTLMSQIEDVPDNSDSHFLLCPLESCKDKPQIVMFVCNPQEACRLLTLLTFIDGVMPKIKIGGPTCRMAVMYPILSGQANISFYDYTARKLCNVERDKMLVAIPYQRIPEMVESIEKCTAGRAKMEYPQEFREFLQRRLAKKAA